MGKDDYPRHLMSELEIALESFRVVNIIGPRQVGKTTLVRELLQKGEYINLDDEAFLEAIEADPKEILTGLKKKAGGDPVIIDEAQRSKKLALAIKEIVDSNKDKGQFVLTGSSNVFAHKKIADSLAGRVVPLKLWPLTISEIKQASPSTLLDWAVQKQLSLEQFSTFETLSRKGYIELILEGGFPEPREQPVNQRQKQYRAYVQAIVDRDVKDVQHIRNIDKFRQLIDQMAARTGQEINYSVLSDALKIKRDTIASYIDVMQRLSLVSKLGAWTSSEARREIKQAKFHFVDTGMNCALRRFDEESFDLGNKVQISEIGGLLESFVFNEMLRLLPYQKKDFHLYHWRSADHREIDIIADGGDHIVGIEVKSSSLVNNDDFKHIKWFAQNGPGHSRNFTGIVFYLGDRALSFSDRCYALPVSAFWTQWNTV
jgi:predicted AAA+ superfamily ATPase